MPARRTIVVLGLLTKIPVAGVAWQTLHYLLGLRRLGFDPYYVEAHARTPSMLMRHPDDDGAAAAAELIGRLMGQFDFGDRWAYHALHDDGRCYGLSERRLMATYDGAELLLNLHGGTDPRPEHSRTGRLVYLETDPVQLQVELAEGRRETLDFLEQHCAFFTFGENWGRPDCGLQPTERFAFHPTRQPVCLDLWPPAAQPGRRFTTIGNWRQRWRDFTVGDRVLTWSKDREFERFLELPSRTAASFELALSSFDADDRARLSEHGWRVVDAAAISTDIVRYRNYVSGSYGEFTAAKEQNVALRSGWFSDRSATYLAAGRPVITQETGFSNVLPTGTGLHAVSSLEEAIEAVETVATDHRRECAAARELAAEHFDAERVLGALLDVVGVPIPGRRAARPALTGELVLAPVSRRPLRLPDATRRQVIDAPVPLVAPAVTAAEPVASVVVVSHDDLALTRLCLESVLANSGAASYELIVVDNGSRDGTRVYLRTLTRRFPHVRPTFNPDNAGFPAAVNQGLALARGEVFVLLNSDTIVAPGWLGRLTKAARAPTTALAGPVTNRIGNEAEIATSYETYAGFLEHAARLAAERAGETFVLPVAAMFCVAMRRELHARIGPLDERFGAGTLEDDDYAERVRTAGLRSVCCEDVLVHHFGEGSLGRLYAEGEHSRLLAANRAAFAEKWGHEWAPYGRRPDAGYEAVRERVREVVGAVVPPSAAVVVVSQGDDELVRFDDHLGWHFPQVGDGTYAGHYPATSDEAIAALERLRDGGARGFVVPRPSLWWLDHYRGLRHHLEAIAHEVVREYECVVYALEAT